MEKNERVLRSYSDSPTTIVDHYDDVPDIAIFESTMDLKYEIIEDLDLNGAVDAAFHKLRALSRSMGIAAGVTSSIDGINRSSHRVERGTGHLLSAALEKTEYAKNMIDEKYPRIQSMD